MLTVIYPFHDDFGQSQVTLIIHHDSWHTLTFTQIVNRRFKIHCIFCVYVNIFITGVCPIQI